MKKNYFFNLLLSLSNLLFPIISFPYVSRVIGPTGVGKVQFITSYAQYFGLIAALGIPVYGIREIAKVKHDRVKLDQTFSELSIIYFFTSILLTVFYIASIFMFSGFSVDRDLYLWSILLVVSSFTSIDWFYEGLEQFKIVAVRSMLVRLLSLLLMFGLIRKANDYHWYLLIMIFVQLANNGVNMIRLRKSVSVTLSGLAFKRHLKPLLFIFSTTIATSMYTVLDTVLLGLLSNTHAVGLYTAAVKLSKIALPIIISLGMVLGPSLAKNFSQKSFADVQLTLNKSFTFTAFFAIPIAFALAILAPEFISVFSSTKFLEATSAMRIMALLPILVGFGYFFGFQILVPDGKDRQMLISVLGGVIIGLMLNFALVPRFQHVGAALANVVSELVVTGLYFFYVKKNYSFTFPVKSLLSAFLSSLVFLPVVWTLRYLSFNVYLMLPCAVVLCSAGYVLIQKLVFSESLITDILEPYLRSKTLALRKKLFSKKIEIYG